MDDNGTKKNSLKTILVMRLNIIIISLLSFILISCNHSKEVTVYKTEPIAINETKIEQT